MTNGEIISGLYEAFAKGDVPTVLGAMDPNIEWNEAEGFMYGGKYIGPNAILENVFMKLATEWEGFTVVPDRVVDGGGNVVALGTYSGSIRRPLRACPFRSHMHGSFVTARS